MLDVSWPWPFATRLDSRLDTDGQGRDSENKSRDALGLLRHFEGSSYSLPPSARVDPSVRQRQREHLGLLGLWKYITFVIVKTMTVIIAFIAHYLWGPRKKSWGWEMTFITSLMQNVSDHTGLADLPTLRRLINMTGYTPLPSDAMVTPVTFTVRRRKLRGILSELDSLEDGSRELSGEWVVGKKLWKKLQAEWKASRSTNGKTSSRDAPKRKDRVILYLHGGAYYMFSAATHRQLTIQLSRYTESRLFAVDYRLAPEVRFPGQIHDAVSAYMRLLELKVPPENILVAGDSAGGALSLVLLMYLRDHGYPLPSGAIVMSPWVDLTMSCDSWDTNAPYDIVATPKPGDHLNPISCYLGEDLEKLVSHPYASPLFGDFHGLPPLLIQAGDSEVLRDEITLLAHKARLAGVQVRYELYEDAVHVFQQFSFLAASEKAFQACRDFTMNDLPTFHRQSPKYLGGATQMRLEKETANEGTKNVNDGGSVRAREPSSSTVASIVLASSSYGARAVQSMHSMANGGTHLKVAKERTAELDAISKDEHNRSSLRRRLGFTPLKQKEENLSRQDLEPRASNYQHEASGEPSSHLLSTPAPAIRARNRTASHPDISSLCQHWADSEPSERPVTYISASKIDS